MEVFERLIQYKKGKSVKFFGLNQSKLKFTISYKPRVNRMTKKWLHEKLLRKTSSKGATNTEVVSNFVENKILCFT